MNEQAESRRTLEEYVARIVAPLAASASRKAIMRADLLAHLNASLGEENDADRVIQRFGDADELRRELQAAVPWYERVVFFSGKEISMWRWIAIILGGAMAMTVVLLIFPAVGSLINIAAVALVCLGFMVRLWDKNASPAWRSSVLCLLGIAGALIGAAIIMPAWAKMNEGVFVMPIVAAMVIGIVITLEGVGFVVLSIRRREAA
jgi:hypothetical protein